jgi:hypothetical protein
VRGSALFEGFRSGEYSYRSFVLRRAPEDHRNAAAARGLAHSGVS